MLIAILLLSGCDASQESKENSEADNLFFESTGIENNWVVNEEEIRTMIGTDERLQKAEVLWGERNEELGVAENALDFKMVSLLDAGAILRSLSIQQNKFVMPLPMDSGFVNFEFSEFEGFSSKNSRFFVGNNRQDPSLEASIFIGGNKIDISISSLDRDLLLEGVPLSSAFDDTYDFIVISKKNRIHRRGKFEAGLINANSKNVKRRASQASGLQHRRLRIAVAATAEYTAFHGQEDTFNQIVSSIARSSRILFQELGLRVVLVSDQSLIFSNPDTDPFDNDSLSNLLVQNQTLLDSEIGDSNYDLGHVFSTNREGGLAYLAGAGISGVKAMGATGGDFPYGDPFTIDYVTHEIGHQLGANHTFTSASCGLKHRNDSTSTEPGSGSSIMSYAGVCPGDNLQLNADKYFHTISYDEIMDHLGTLNLETYQSANSAPTVNVSNGPFTIPIGTPFILSAEGFDNEQDIIYYAWDQIDIDLDPVDLGNQTSYSPLFRSYPISRDSFRIFPSLPLLLNQSPYKGELLPDRTRDLNFSCVVRDLRGGINYQDVKLNVTSTAGPFKVVTPNNFIVFNKNAINTIKWNQANTHKSPVKCDSVDIFLTMDRGKNLISLGRYKNSGSEDVNFGNYTTTKARIWIQGKSNVFFDISDNDFEIK